MTAYRQYLPDLDLALERDTDRTPDRRGWFLIQGDAIRRFGSEKQARAAWKAIIEEAGWRPQQREVDPERAMREATAERWARNRAG